MPDIPDLLKSIERLEGRTIDGKPQWDFCCEWYGVDAIERVIKGRYGDEVPRDVTSREFAEWLTHQYRLAMNKGMELARAEIPSLARQVRELIYERDKITGALKIANETNSRRRIEIDRLSRELAEIRGASP